jgi:hypothetical protein
MVPVVQNDQSAILGDAKAAGFMELGAPQARFAKSSAEVPLAARL